MLLRLGMAAAYNYSSLFSSSAAGAAASSALGSAAAASLRGLRAARLGFTSSPSASVWASAAFSSAFSTLRSSTPSAIAAQQALRMISTESLASSLAGITKSMLLGSELVSTIPNTGIPRRLASRTAICSFSTSTTKSALGRRVRSAIEPRFFSSLAR